MLVTTSTETVTPSTGKSILFGLRILRYALSGTTLVRTFAHRTTFRGATKPSLWRHPYNAAHDTTMNARVGPPPSGAQVQRTRKTTV